VKKLVGDPRHSTCIKNCWWHSKQRMGGFILLECRHITIVKSLRLFLENCTRHWALPLLAAQWKSLFNQYPYKMIFTYFNRIE